MKIIAKLGKMRKAVEWIVYPPREDGQILIQSDKRICLFNRTTGIGVLSASHNYPMFETLRLPSAETIVVPEEVVREALEKQPQKGDRIGSVGFIG